MRQTTMAALKNESYTIDDILKYTFSNKVKVGIYADLEIDFSEIR